MYMAAVCHLTAVPKSNFVYIRSCHYSVFRALATETRGL